MRRAPIVVLLLLATALAGCGSDDDPDRDGDGLTDAEEHRGWTITIDHVDRREVREVTSDPRKDDTDGDGIPDAFEFGLGTDPRRADTDGDGLTDCQEAFHTVLDDCEDPDWTGTSDGGHRTTANRADSDPGIGRYVNRHLAFSDPTGSVDEDEVPWGDGLTDGEEIHGVLLPDGRRVQLDPMKKDTDDDGLEDGEEVFLHNSDPTDPDTDGDGCVDGRDTWPDRVERFALEVDGLELNGSGTARLDVLVRIADATFHQRSDVAWERGSNRSMEIDAEAVRPGQCSFPPYNPWVNVEFLVVDGEGGVLDLTSHRHASGGFRMDWNVRTGGLRWPDGSPAGTGLAHWTGPDGSVSLGLLMDRAPPQAA